MKMTPTLRSTTVSTIGTGNVAWRNGKMQEDIRPQIWAMGSTELNELADVIKARRQQIRQQEMNTFQVGEKVQFTTKRGELRQGVVTQKNRKSIGVSTDAGSWRVSPSFLNKVVAPEMFGGL